MNFKLKRTASNVSGIFSVLTEGDSGFFGATLEHSYQDGDAFKAKIPVGIYVCKRGWHRLHNMTENFETFEVTGVPDHEGILFHKGNFNKDSEGCILVGMEKSGNMITGSKDAFANFMKLLAGVDEFTLTVEAQ